MNEDALFIFAVNGQGQVRGEGWDGAAWTSYELGAPDAQLSPLARLGAVDAGTGEADVFAIAEDGGLWGLRWRWRHPAVPVGRWQKLGEGYEPGGSVTAWRAEGAPIVLAVNAVGVIVETMVYPTEPDGLSASAVVGRDWFVPGSPVAAFTLGRFSDARSRYFAVQADRTVVEGWGNGQPALMEPGMQWAVLSGPSQLAVDLPAGTHVTLSSEGVLTALRDHPLVPAPAGFAGPAGNETAIEMPWGLFLALDAGQPAYLRHADRPRASSAIVELWHSWLGSHRQGDGQDAGQTLLRPAWPRPADPQGWLPEHNVPLFAPPLTHEQRTAIVERAKDGAPVTADRAIFSSLGGWLTAGGSWSDFGWQHHAVVGRDLMVRTLTRGILFPFGHEAEYEEVTLRGFDERGESSVALLHKRGTLRILEPVRTFSDYDASAFREFPFNEVEIALRVVADLDPSPDGTYFWPTSNGGRVRFPLRLRGAAGEVLVRMPLIFVKGWTFGSDADPAGLVEVQTQYGSVHVDVSAAPVALAADQAFEVHAFDFGPAPAPGERGTILERGLRPRIDRARVALPALRQFAPQAASTYEVTFESAYVERGDAAVLLRLADGATLPVDFGGRSDAAGGVARPGFVADAISGAGAPIKADAVSPGAFFKDAKLLGLIPLEELLPKTGWKPPLVRSEPQPAGLPPKMILDWNDVALNGHGVFVASADCRLALNVTSVPAPDGPTEAADGPVALVEGPRVTTTGSLTAFKLNLAGVLVVSFSSLTFTSQPDEKPALKIGGLDVAFAGDLQFLNVLQDAMRAVQGTMPVTIDASPTSITVSEHAELPSISLGAGLFAVTVSGAVLNTSLKLPFDGEMEIDFSFGSRKHPFRVGVWILGGGGYLELRIRRDPNTQEFVVRELLASVEIGGVWSLDWVVVKGEVHALAGIEIRLLEGGGVRLSGYVRVGGSVEALGLVSVSIEVTAEITAEDTDEMFHVLAAASVVIEVDLFLVSAPLELEQTIVIYEDRHAVPALGTRPKVPAAAGEPQRIPPVVAPPPQRTFSADEGRAAWKEYREAFAHATPA